ncbi:MULTISPECIES: hypothetical protein [Aneurinibacillus]|uniref:Uncharacterized protein n=1 Tax=Aneurinibacillus thermoaerophilus TaxID=143495 RepID=A0A1G8APS8_ANETH|nr:MULTISPECIES: hypothetical protein [Aneurinibacillus]AMA74255.1 hypothetical protein ACH33_16445 [Aneurinibacillus sp. XH2]MED0676745.1 hypothetical protein [Aneurinibacillus thermoaerophilus]MED0738628.1 hypothetical protein [Aneurinibacillus thermoaerophilus]MED0758729.1 hypothetical protein [Aneurinibacillus thermoaerophilus]MED0760567.1 hypothetical protein [Aneurinibacillus thermoaerophilus]
MTKKRKKKKPATAVSKRLTGFKQSLYEIASQVNETKESASKIEKALNQTKSVARRTRTTRSKPRQRRRINLFPFLRRKNQTSESGRTRTKRNDSKGLDAAALIEILQNPAVQTLIKKGLNSGVVTKLGKTNNKKPNRKEGLSDTLSGIDFAEITKLLQNPMVQSMLKNMF